MVAPSASKKVGGRGSDQAAKSKCLMDAHESASKDPPAYRAVTLAERPSGAANGQSCCSGLRTVIGQKENDDALSFRPERAWLYSDHHAMHAMKNAAKEAAAVGVCRCE